MEVDDEFVKDRAAAGFVYHVIDLLLGKRTVPAKQRSADAFALPSSAVSDVAQMRFDPVFAPDVARFYDGHSRLFSFLCGVAGMSLFIFVIFSHAFSWHAVMIGTSSSGDSTMSVRKRRIWMERSRFCSAA